MIAFTTHRHQLTGITSFLFELLGRDWVLTVTKGMIICGWERVIASHISPTVGRDDPVWPSYRLSCWPGKVLSVDDAAEIIRQEYRLAGAAA
jgi:hypothetical protein